ncbi:MAG: hypothetical protein BWY68_00626 [bacterium ADurb.Bin400]|nr:MAG: hypothetical protein BWY68_00626 [bacterium ADurb.Bin400]
MLRRILTGAIGAMVVALSVSTPNTATAQQSSGRGITVTPLSFELYANPGESVIEKVRIRNEADVAGSYQIIVEDFRAVGEEGEVDLVDDQSNTSYSLAKWVFPEPKRFTIGAGEEKEIVFTINVPKNAEPGGHYASILVKMGGDSSDLAGQAGAAVSTRVGSLILLRVSGNVKEDAVVESFTTSQKRYQGSPVNFDLRVKNTGNNHIRPKGTIVITNMFGQKVTEVELNGLNVLPDAIRKMETEWKFNAFLANRYTATLVATYGQQSKPLSASTSFYIVPQSLVVALGVFGFILVGIVLGRKKIKRALHNMTK